MPNLKHDIESEEDIKLMVDSFYDLVNKDDLLSPVFNGFAGVNWDKHLPIMYSFWNNLLFGAQSYKGNPFAKHVPLPVDKKHFDRWILLFDQNMDNLFEGERAESAKLRAKSIAHVFQSKLSYIHQNSKP